MGAQHQRTPWRRRRAKSNPIGRRATSRRRFGVICLMTPRTCWASQVRQRPSSCRDGIAPPGTHGRATTMPGAHGIAVALATGVSELKRSHRGQSRIRLGDGTPVLRSAPSPDRARQLLFWGLLLASLLLYCVGRFLNAPQPRPASPSSAEPRFRAPAPNPLSESPPAQSAPALSASVPPPPHTARQLPTAVQLPEIETIPATPPKAEPAGPDEPFAGVRPESLARQLDATRGPASRWPRLFGVALDGDSSLGAGRVQLGYGRWSAEPLAGFNSRNGTALEEPGCLYVKLRLRF